MSAFFDAYALTGGLLIGLSASLLLLFNGRIAGISGICVSLFSLSVSGKNIRGAGFIIAMILAGGMTHYLMSDGASSLISDNATALRTDYPAVLIILSGFLVGAGTRLANGCTSGHGVCGLGRRSLRSLAATLCFMLTGVLTVGLLRLTGVLV